jgi:hypothetical protein
MGIVLRSGSRADVPGIPMSVLNGGVKFARPSATREAAMGRGINKRVACPKSRGGSYGLEYAALVALAVVICLVAVTSPAPDANPAAPRDDAMVASAGRAD